MRKLLRTFLFFIAGILLLSDTTIAQVSADFTANTTSGCSPLTVSFTDNSTGSPTSWSWNFGNGNTSASQNPSAVYVTPGTYTVTLTVSNSTSTDTKTKTAYITVFQNPVADFTTNPSNVCTGQQVTFTDNSTVGGGPITSWNWDFGDGNTQNTSAGNANHVYTAGGNFPASLIVTDQNGCTSNITHTVSVTASPVADFTASPTSQCTAPMTVTFNNTSTPSTNATYSWNFGDGGTSTQQNPQHTYTSTGSYNVTLVVTHGGCTDTIVKNNFITIQHIAADFVADTTKACIGSPIIFTDLSSPASISRTWYFGDGGTDTAASPTHSYGSAGTFQVSLVVTDASGCTDSIAKTTYITIYAPPQISFTADTTSSCNAPFTVNFTDNSTNAQSWSWNFGDGSTSTSQNPSHTYTSPGTYDVSLSVTSPEGCSSFHIIPAYINIKSPHVDFTCSTSQGCVPHTVTFISLSTDSLPGDSIVNYDWTFGDGSTASAAADSISSNTYDSLGVFSVSLVITTSGGCQDSIVKTDTIKTGTPPTADFSIVDSNVCYNTPVQFNNLSSSSANEWQWHFGDGQIDTTMNPPHNYSDTGTYNVTLIAYNNGCGDTITHDSIVHIAPPKPKFSYQLNCSNPYSVSFTNTSEGADSIVWDFGDGTIDTTNNQTPTHIYGARGSYTVSLTAYNFTTGCSSPISQSFTITDPIAAFGIQPASGCYPLVANFTDSSQDAVGYSWNLGDGHTSFHADTLDTYPTPGAYNITLTIVDIHGCTSTLTKTAGVKVLGPIPDFAADTTVGCRPLTVNFSDSTKSDSAIVYWIWNYGDGTVDTLTSPNATHTFAQIGTFGVKLSVLDVNGCLKTIYKPGMITTTFPYPAFSVDTFACTGNVLTFNASATNAVNPSYHWDFGDNTNTTTSVDSVMHAFTHDSTYTVSLTVTDQNGCDSTITHNVLILKPTGNFTDSILNVGCGTEQVSFNDASTGYVNGWSWNFGNGAVSQLQNPSYTYTAPGYYNVSLIVTNQGGCKDTVSLDSLVVVPGPYGGFNYQPSTGCTPLTVTFHANTNNTDSYTWDFGDGTVITNGDSVMQHTYYNNFSGQPILLLGDTLSNGSPCQLPANNLGGSISAQSLVNVHINTDSITLGPEDSYGLTTTVSNVTGAPVYSWSPSDGLSCNNCADPTVVSTNHTTIYVLTVTDTAAGGCQGFDSVKVFEIPCDMYPVFPNVFTPNGDGNNDLFVIKNLCPGDYSLQIYNRWGKQVFATHMHTASDKYDAWNGVMTNGHNASSGVYYYIVKSNDSRYVGYFELIRGTK